MSEHIHLFVQKYKSKNCKIVQKYKKQVKMKFIVLLHRRVKQSKIKVCVAPMWLLQMSFEFALAVYAFLFCLLWKNERESEKAQSWSLTNSVSHSKLKKPLRSLNLLFPLLCENALTHQWQLVNFCYFYFCTVEEKNRRVHACVKFIFMLPSQGKRELNLL